MVRSRQEAVKKAMAARRNVPNTCQKVVRTWLDAPSAGDRDGDGDADAVDGWKSEPKSKRHTDRNPPAGVPVAWSGGSHGHGHRALSLGNGMIRTTDGNGSGRVATQPLDWPERHWGLKYLGWSETIDGVAIPGAPAPKPDKPKPAPAPKPTKSMAVLVKEVLDNKWGIGPARKKKLEAAGYDYDKVQAAVNAELAKPKPAPKPDKPKPAPTPAPKPDSSSKSFVFNDYLVPGNKSQTMKSVMGDMHTVLKTAGLSALVNNTERESRVLLMAVERGLGKNYKRVIDNEVTIAYGSDWKQTKKPKSVLLNPKDPHKLHVSGDRHVDTFYGENAHLLGVTIADKSTHLLSEANCEHVKIFGREWREKNWIIQLHDVIADCKKDHDAGYPIVLNGDFNTGIHFNGKKLFAEFKKVFGDKVAHVHNGHLDHILIISTDAVKLEEVGQEKDVNNASDHDEILAKIKVTKLK